MAKYHIPQLIFTAPPCDPSTAGARLYYFMQPVLVITSAFM